MLEKFRSGMHFKGNNQNFFLQVTDKKYLKLATVNNVKSKDPKDNIY